MPKLYRVGPLNIRPVGGVGEGFSVTTGNLQMIGKRNRRTNVPVLAFAVAAGTAMGVMVGRGMARPWPEPETWAGAPEGSFPVMAVENLATEVVSGPHREWLTGTFKPA